MYLTASASQVFSLLDDMRTELERNGPAQFGLLMLRHPGAWDRLEEMVNHFHIIEESARPTAQEQPIPEPATPPQESYITIPEFCNKLGISRTSFYTHICHRSDFPGRKVGSRVLIPASWTP